SLTKEERTAFLEALTDFRITPKSFRPIDEAIITSGGVDVKEISPKTMELKGYPGIYVCGELIDVDAYTGGYNLQIAFATGKLAGEAAAQG
ncbi:MAG: NAD(P)/FAD-dependent oxidoreductase, partial [Clostridia bacterium]|nr:NAD(P)/FAD-dependent oxidoreductase [Clostridia bacterium]